MMKRQIVNIAAYKFVDLPKAEQVSLRNSLRTRCLAWDLKGTILLSPEGINLFVAGRESAVGDFRNFLTALEPFRDLDFKISFSETLPFRKMQVKLKDQIIPMAIPGVFRPSAPQNRLSARKLKKWLDEGRDFLLLDTRNDYEIAFGTFAKARHLHIKTFREFPQAAERLDPAAKTKPVVMFCTGGIRCEKAAPLLVQKGFAEVYQLDGGILKYFEEVGEAHFSGDCFVFDNRVALNARLQVSGVKQCPHCFKPVKTQKPSPGAATFTPVCPACRKSIGSSPINPTVDL